MTRPQTDLLVGTLASLAMVILLVVADDAAPRRMAQHERRQQALNIEAGAALFAEHCRTCHGVNGEGVGQLGPALNTADFFSNRLAEVGWPETLDAYIRNSIAQGRITATRPLYAGAGSVAMTAWAQAYGGPLRTDEVANLAAFVRNWETTASGAFEAPPLVVPTPEHGSSAERVARGAELFRTAGCSQCHVVPGVEGAQAGPNLVGIAATAQTRVPGYTPEEYIRESFLIPNAFVVTGYEPDLGCGGVLTHEQLDELVGYLLSLE